MSTPISIFQALCVCDVCVHRETERWEGGRKRERKQGRNSWGKKQGNREIKKKRFTARWWRENVNFLLTELGSNWWQLIKESHTQIHYQGQRCANKKTEEDTGRWNAQMERVVLCERGKIFPSVWSSISSFLIWTIKPDLWRPLLIFYMGHLMTWIECLSYG